MENEINRNTRWHRNRCGRITLYVPTTKIALVNDVKKMFEREDSSISKFFVEKIEEYHRLHEPGNPQQLLPTILKLGKTYHAPNPICRVKDCFKPVDVVLVFKKSKKEREEVGMCSKHGKWFLSEYPESYERLSKT